MQPKAKTANGGRGSNKFGASMSNSRTRKAKEFLDGLLPSRTLESLPTAESTIRSLMPVGRVPEQHKFATESAVAKLATGAELTGPEQFALEAIIIPDKRPAIDIVNGDFTINHPLWTHFGDEPIRSRIRKAIPSVGRIELPGNPLQLPYAGTGFVVGSQLLMTNRHVAEIFCSGLGNRSLLFRQGYKVGVDFLRERGNPASIALEVRAVLMIHPYWDMALLRVDGIPAGQSPLVLSLQHPEDLVGRDVAVIGYPAFDPRNDADVQNQVFGGIYSVKRLEPGVLKQRALVESFGKQVSAATHDSSTLGGNSGSAVIDVETGHVVGLHFAGVYLDKNYAVPTSELARDGRVVDAGVNFDAGTKPEPGIWDEWWQRANQEKNTGTPTDPIRTTQVPISSIGRSADDRAGLKPGGTAVLTAGDTATWTIPIEITVRVGARSALANGRSGGSSSPKDAEASISERSRDKDSLKQGPLTFRDHFSSLYQSAVGEIARKIASRSGPAEGIEGVTGDAASSLILAAEGIAQLHASDRTSSHSGASSPEEESFALERMSTFDQVRVCASLGWQLLAAEVIGDSATAKRIEDQLQGSSCDPQWAETIREYLRYFGPSGTRRQPLYVTPDKVRSNVITIKSGAKIALVGDWGTGAAPARRVLEQVKAQKPDILIHLGDIYYSGTESECSSNFEAIVNEIFERPKTNLPVYTLAGNHDMYCGGVGYYGLIKRLNSAPMAQEASFFCLRAEDESWQILAMDTGQHDWNPFTVNDVVTFVESAEEEWHRKRLEEFSGKTILMSHHQLFSAFSQIGKPSASGKLLAYNPQLQATYEKLSGTGKRIAAWFWGHEHNLCIYAPYNGLRRGRCLGHSAIPVFTADTPYDPLPEIESPPAILPGTTLTAAGQYYTHGFAMLALNATGIATADYYEDLSGVPRNIFSEKID
jgi:hypothetical protein